MNESSNSQQAGEATGETPDAGVYVPPKLTVLGTLAELTQLGRPRTDELLSDGSKA